MFEPSPELRSLAADSTCCWYAAYTKPCHEKRVEQHLRTRDIESFLPLYSRKRRWNNGCTVVVERPLFPGYVFVHIAINDRVRVLDLSGVLSIVGTRRGPVALPADEISRLRAGLPLVHAEPHALLTIGDTARISRGPLQGMVGVITRQKNSLRVVLTIELIMKSVAVEISAEDLEPVQRLSHASSQRSAFAAQLR